MTGVTLSAAKHFRPGDVGVGPIYTEGPEYEVVTVMGSAAIKIAKHWLPTH